MFSKSSRIIFAGTPEFAAKHLDALIRAGYNIIAVLTQPDRPIGRGQKVIPSPVKELAIQHNIPVHQPKTLRDEAIQKTLRDLNIDLFIDVAFGLIIPKVVLDIPRFGCINVHGSLLPRWRGAAPIQHAILSGDKETGVTIMEIDEGLDTGDMLLQASCPIYDTDTLSTLTDRLAEVGTKSLLEALEKLANNQLKAIKQDDAKSNYAKKIEKEDAKINWTKSAIEIDRQIRAFNPKPVAYSELRGEIIRIWQGELLTDLTDAEPGTIISINKQGIDIATGKGVLRLKVIQFSGGKALPVAAILNSKKDFFEANNKFTI